MKSRAEAAAKLNELMLEADKSIPTTGESVSRFGPDAHHFGWQELRQFMDWFYDREPAGADEMLGEKHRNNTAPKEPK